MNYRPVFFAIIQTVGLFVSGFVIPVLGQLLALLTPVPLIIAYVRNGKTEGFTSLIVSCVIIGFLGGGQAAAVFFLTFGLMAAGTSEGMRRQWKPESSVLLGGLLPVIVLTAAIGYYFARAGKNPITEIEQYLRGSLGEAAKFYAQIGLSEMATVITSVSDTFVHYLVRLIPGLTITASLVQAACCYGLSRAVIARRPGNEAPPAQSSFADWHAPDVWVWGLIATLTLILVPAETTRFVGWNFTIVYAVVYLTQGVAVADHFLRKARIKPFIRGLLHTLILALPSIVFVIALGIVDIWADFRKIRKPVKADDVPPWQRL